MEVVPKRVVTLFVNGLEKTVEVLSHETLARVLSERLGLTGTKIGCDSGECGACTVLINGEVVASCLVLAIECDGKEIITIEGLADPKTGELHPIQQAFVDHHGYQCGYCTAGMILSAKALLDKNPKPTDGEIKEAINGVICRCGGYVNIAESIAAAARSLARAK